MFFFKQKTAYEMRISDWSSDVCSSDLSKTAAAANSTRTTRWPPTTSPGCGANLASRTCANSWLPLTSMPTVNLCPCNAQGPYLASDDYSIADIATYPWIARFPLHGLEWAAVPNVKRWFDAVGARPAVASGMAVPSA